MMVEPLPGAPFGAAVRGELDPSRLPALLAEYQLLVVPGERSDDEHVALISCLGRVLPQGPRVNVSDPAPANAPPITLVSNTGREQLGSFELLFHHDLAHTPNPYAGLSLYSVDVAAGQAPTRFASGVCAHRQLSNERKGQLEQLQGLFIGNYTTISDRSVDARQAREMLDPRWPFAVHPIVVEHPQSRVPCLFVNEMQTIEVLGLPTDASDVLLDELFAILYEPDNVYEHHWHPHQLVVWDNIALQHARPQITEATPRTLRRVVWGDRAPWENWRRSS